MSKSNDLARFIINDLYKKGIFSWRANTTGIPDARTGRLRTAAKKGVADILGIIPPNGRALAIEIKIGTDRLNPEQEGFLKTIKSMGGVALIVKDEDEYLKLIKQYA